MQDCVTLCCSLPFSALKVSWNQCLYAVPGICSYKMKQLTWHYDVRLRGHGRDTYAHSETTDRPNDTYSPILAKPAATHLSLTPFSPYQYLFARFCGAQRSRKRRITYLRYRCPSPLFPHWLSISACSATFAGADGTALTCFGQRPNASGLAGSLDHGLA